MLHSFPDPVKPDAGLPGRWATKTIHALACRFLIKGLIKNGKRISQDLTNEKPGPPVASGSRKIFYFFYLNLVCSIPAI